MGVDAQQTVESVLNRSVSRRWLLDALGKSHAKHVFVFLDACFSGKDRGGQVLAQGLRPIIPTAMLGSLARGAILTAASSDEASSALDDAKHGLFTYFLLGALRGWGNRDPSRPVTVAGAYRYVQIAMESYLASGDREQDPDLDASIDSKGTILASGLGERGPDLRALGEFYARFEPPVDGTIHDAKTGLIWQQGIAPGTYSLDDAKAYCASLRLPGTGWRLPTADELKDVAVSVKALGAPVNTQDVRPSGASVEHQGARPPRRGIPSRPFFWTSVHVPVFPDPGFMDWFYWKQWHLHVKCVRSPP